MQFYPQGPSTVESIPPLIQLLLLRHVLEMGREVKKQNLRSDQENQRPMTSSPWPFVLSRYIGSKPIGLSL